MNLKELGQVEGKKRGKNSKVQEKVVRVYGKGCKECGVDLDEHR